MEYAHFHGTEVAKPSPSYQTYKGRVFQLVDQAINFVMSKIAAQLSTRSQSAPAPAPVTYEIPREQDDRAPLSNTQWSY